MPCQHSFAQGATSHLYIFIDESGDFNFSAHGSPYYVFSAIWTYVPECIASELISYRYQLLHLGHDIEQFHAHNDPRPIRTGVFSRLNLHRCIKGASLVIEKNKLNPALYRPTSFYPQFLDYLVKFILKGEARNSYEHVLLFTDREPPALQTRSSRVRAGAPHHTEYHL